MKYWLEKMFYFFRKWMNLIFLWTCIVLWYFWMVVLIKQHKFIYNWPSWNYVFPAILGRSEMKEMNWHWIISISFSLQMEFKKLRFLIRNLILPPTRGREVGEGWVLCACTARHSKEMKLLIIRVSTGKNRVQPSLWCVTLVFLEQLNS